MQKFTSFISDDPTPKTHPLFFRHVDFSNLLSFQMKEKVKPTKVHLNWNVRSCSRSQKFDLLFFLSPFFPFARWRVKVGLCYKFLGLKGEKRGKRRRFTFIQPFNSKTWILTLLKSHDNPFPSTTYFFNNNTHTLTEIKIHCQTRL